VPEPGSSLLHPSGSLEATIAHRLHQPSFTTSLCTGTETADKSNGCIAMVMGNAYRENETLIYDHLHRRSKKSEGLENYPENVVECHEQFTQKIMESSHAKVEVVYGRQVQARVLHSGLKTTAIPLWGSFANIFSISYTKATLKTSSQVTAFGKFCYSPLILNECFTNAKVAKLPFDKIEFLKQPCGLPMQQSPFKLTITSQAMTRICSICQPTRAISSRKTL